VTSCAWNRQLVQVLAAGDEVGDTKVFDLRTKRAAMTLHHHDRAKTRVHAISWRPDTSVNVAVAYTSSSIVETWDVRKATIPVQKLRAGANGYYGLDWCPHDPLMILASGDDNKTYTWHADTGSLLSEYWSYGMVNDLRWSPAQPSLVATSAEDGKIAIHSVQAAGNHVPKWNVRSVGASFGFGGKLLTWGQLPSETDEEKKAVASGNPSSPPAKKEVAAPQGRISIAQLVTDPQLLELSTKFQGVVATNDYANFCSNKITSAADDNERRQWTVLRILLDPRQQKANLLKELGFSLPNDGKAAESSEGQPSAAATPAAAATGEAELPKDDASFFDNLAAAQSDLKSPSGEDVSKPLSPVEDLAEAILRLKAEPVASTDSETADDAAVRAALTVGDFRAAVTRSISARRMADALLFASCAGGSLWEDTRAAFFKQHRSPFVRTVVRAVVHRDHRALVAESELKNWQETLAILLTYTEHDQSLINALAQRLEQHHEVHAAIICYIIANNLDKTVELWGQQQARSPSNSSNTPQGHIIALHASIEKISIFAQSTALRGQTPSRAITSKYSEYAGLLAGQGCLAPAWDYLRLVVPRPTPNDESTAILLDRIYRAQPSQQGQPPPFPFAVAAIPVDPNLKARPANTLSTAPRGPIPPTGSTAPPTGYGGRSPAADPRTLGGHAHHPPAGRGGPVSPAPGGPHSGWGPPAAGGRGQPPPPGPTGPTGPAPGGYPPQVDQYGRPIGPGAVAAPPGGRGGPGPMPPVGASGGYPGGPRPPAGFPHGPQPPPPQVDQYGRPIGGPSGAPTGPPPSYPGGQPPVTGRPPGPQGGYPPQVDQYGRPLQPTGAPTGPGSYPPIDPTGGRGPAPPTGPPQHVDQYGRPIGGQHPPVTSGGPPPPQVDQYGRPIGGAATASIPPPPTSGGFQGPPTPSGGQGGFGRGPAPTGPQPPLPTPSLPAAPIQPPVNEYRPPSAPTTPVGPAPSHHLASAPIVSPAAAAPAAPVEVPADRKQFVTILEALVAAVGGKVAASDEKKIPDIQKRVQTLFTKLGGNDLSSGAVNSIREMTDAMARGDFESATRHHGVLVREEWTGNDGWLPGVKTLLLLAKKYVPTFTT
jgi:protein transport protein SEC31